VGRSRADLSYAVISCAHLRRVAPCHAGGRDGGGNLARGSTFVTVLLDQHSMLIAMVDETDIANVYARKPGDLHRRGLPSREFEGTSSGSTQSDVGREGEYEVWWPSTLRRRYSSRN